MSEEATRLEGFDPSEIFNNNYLAAPGEALLILHSEQEQVVARSSIVPFILGREDGKSIYRGMTFIVPPTSVWERDEDGTFELVLGGLADLGYTITLDMREQVKERFVFIRCDTLDSAALVDTLRSAPQRRFVIVPSATLYRFDSNNSASSHRNRIALAEDRWVPEVARLAEEIVKVAEEHNSFVLMSSTADVPVKGESKDLLSKVDGLSFAAHGSADTPELLEQMTRWAAMAVSGQAQEALRQLEEKKLPEQIEMQARVVIARRSGDSALAAQLVRRLLEKTVPEGPIAVQWASICFKANDTTTTAQLLAKALPALGDEGLLEECLQMATGIKRADLVELARARLLQLFPKSMSLLLDSEARLLQLCSLSSPIDQRVSISRAGFTECHDFILSELEHANSTYASLIDVVGTRWHEHVELARMCAALHAEESCKSLEALILACPLIPDTRFSGGAASLLLRVMRQMLLSNALSQEDAEVYKTPLAGVIAHLGQNPNDGWMRVELVKTLSVMRAGAIGLPLLASVALDFVKTAPLPAPEPSPVELATEQELTDFLARLSTWMDGRGSSVIDPRVPLPMSVAGENAAGLARLIRQGFERDPPTARSFENLQEYEFPTLMLPPLVLNVPDGTDDIHVLRTLAGKYAMLGHPQLARDRAELIMDLAGGSALRNRLAWAAYADIYLRTRSIPDALVGLTCAAATNARIPGSDLFQETYTLVRITRDLGLVKIAENALETCRALYAGLGMTELMQHRLDVTALTLRVRTVSTDDIAALEALLHDSKSALEEATRLGDEVSVVAFLFAQVVVAFEQAGGAASSEVVALKAKALESLGDGADTVLQAVGATRPSAVDVVALHNLTTGSRYSDDAPNDAFAVNVSAHRLLMPGHTEILPRDAFLAAELLTDRGLTLAEPAPKLKIDWPLQYAQSLIEREVAVLMLALDDDGELVAAIADSSGAYVARPKVADDTAENRLSVWLKKYPYRYGLISPREKKVDERTRQLREVGDKEFYDSMAQFEIPVPLGQRLLVVAEPAVAQLTFNLVVKDRELIGYSHALGMVPSLTWLAGVQARPRANGVDRRIAWISAGRGEEEALQAMDVVREMIGETLQTHGVLLDTGEALPKDVRGAQMGIVVAHGQLTEDSRFFHRVVDEGALREAPEDVARAFANVELVVLFVCSGGRIDVHPMVSTTVGLPKMLLDRGCRTVLASPWPLESLAPGVWLPQFLAAWDRGETAMDACHKANLHVASRREYEPQVSLAMTVYGDPLLTKPRTGNTPC